MPFLENVTRGRGVPPERLAAVAEHYMHFVACPRSTLSTATSSRAWKPNCVRRNRSAGVYFGNRNWHPMVEDTVARMRDDGVRKRAVFPNRRGARLLRVSSVRRGHARARDAAGPDAPSLEKAAADYDHPLMVAAFADAIHAARETAFGGCAGRARLVFNRALGTPRCRRERRSAGRGRPTSTAGRSPMRPVCAQRAGHRRLRPGVAVALRSAAGAVARPDICDHLDTVAASGAPAVIVCPVGFVSDHLEVVWDLDTEARDKAAELGIEFVRAATTGTDRRFPRMIRELVEERRAGAAPRGLGREPLLGATVDGVAVRGEMLRAGAPSGWKLARDS